MGRSAIFKLSLSGMVIMFTEKVTEIETEIETCWHYDLKSVADRGIAQLKD